MKAYDLVIVAFETIQDEVREFHHDCFVYAKELAIKMDIEVKKPRTCQRQRFRQNAVGSHNLTQEEAAEEYFRINVTIPFVDQVITSMKSRFDGGQSLVIKGTMLIPACAFTEPD